MASFWISNRTRILVCYISFPCNPSRQRGEPTQPNAMRRNNRQRCWEIRNWFLWGGARESLFNKHGNLNGCLGFLARGECGGYCLNAKHFLPLLLPGKIRQVDVLINWIRKGISWSQWTPSPSLFKIHDTYSRAFVEVVNAIKVLEKDTVIRVGDEGDNANVANVKILNQTGDLNTTYTTFPHSPFSQRTETSKVRNLRG